jgi:hypothetical protein
MNLDVLMWCALPCENLVRKSSGLTMRNTPLQQLALELGSVHSSIGPGQVSADTRPKQ